MSEFLKIEPTTYMAHGRHVRWLSDRVNGVYNPLTGKTLSIPKSHFLFP